MPEMTYEKISADEAHSLRQKSLGPSDSLVKGVPVLPDVIKGSSWDKARRSARFVMSAEISDRMGDIVVQEGLNIDQFLANPQALLFHNSRSWPIGRWDNVEKMLGGRPKRTEGDMVLLAEGEDRDADRAARHIAAGTMRTVSIGFKVDWEAIEAIRDENKHVIGLRYMSSELLECSLVPIPALPAAMMKEADPSMLSKEHLELIEMTLDNFDKDPRTGLVIRRDVLEAQRKDLDGNKSFAHFEKIADETMALKKSMEDVLALVTKLAGDPPKPQDGEEVPIAPNPADTEKQKALDAAFIKNFDAELRRSALESSEPGLFVRLLRSFGLHADNNRQTEEEELEVKENDGTETLEVTEFTDADKTALQNKVKDALEQSKSVAENAGAAG